MAWKWRFLSNWLHLLRSCRAIWSGVVLCMEFNYSFLSTMTFRTNVCFFTFLLVLRLPSFCLVWPFSRVVSRSSLQVSLSFSAKLILRPVALFRVAWLSTIPIIRSFVSHLFGGVEHTMDYFRLRSFHRFPAAHVCYLTWWGFSSRTQRLLSFNTCVVVYVSFSLFSTILFQDFIQLTFLFSWLWPDAVDDISTMPLSPSRVAPATSPTSGSSPVAATAAVFTPPTMAT